MTINNKHAESQLAVLVIVLLTVVCFVTGCKAGKSKKEKVQVINHIRYELLQAGSDKENEGISTEILNPDDAYWFNLRISVEGYSQSPMRYNIRSNEEYTSRVQYLTFQAQQDFFIQCDDKKFIPQSYIFENNYNMTSFENIMMSFLKSDELKHCEECFLVFNDRLFKNGFVKFNLNLN